MNFRKKKDPQIASRVSFSQGEYILYDQSISATGEYIGNWL